MVESFRESVPNAPSMIGVVWTQCKGERRCVGSAHDRNGLALESRANSSVTRLQAEPALPSGRANRRRNCVVRIAFRRGRETSRPLDSIRTHRALGVCVAAFVLTVATPAFRPVTLGASGALYTMTDLGALNCCYEWVYAIAALAVNVTV